MSRPPTLLFAEVLLLFDKCSYDGRKTPDGILSAYMAWYDVDHNRVGRKLKYCVDCFTDRLEPYVRESLTTAPDERYESCLGCHNPIAGEGAIVYATLYPPRSERVDAELWFCFKDFDVVRAELAKLGQELPDRQAAVAAPARSPWLRLDDLMPAS